MNAKFAALEKLKNNNWKEEEKKKARKVIKKSKAKVLSLASYIINVQCRRFVCYSYLSV